MTVKYKFFFPDDSWNICEQSNKTKCIKNSFLYGKRGRPVQRMIEIDAGKTGQVFFTSYEGPGSFYIDLAGQASDAT